jgi:hypothetical protein
MNKFVWILSIFISSAAFAGECNPPSPNCYLGDINGDRKNDEIKFVVGGDSTLKLKITRTATRPLIKAHDKYEQAITSDEYITISESADIFKKPGDDTGDFRMTVLEGQRTVNLQWKEKDGTFELKKFQIQPNGNLIAVSDNGE